MKNPLGVELKKGQLIRMTEELDTPESMGWIGSNGLP